MCKFFLADKKKFLPLRSANGEDREVGTDEENFFKKLRKNLEDKKKLVPLRSQTGRTVKAGS